MPINTYNQTYNYDNAVLRYVIVALLAELRNRIYIYQHPDNKTTEKVDIPFMYSITGSERFLKDEFMYDSLINGKAIGDYEKVPRGVIELNNVGIDSASQTNKFIQTRFVKEMNGELKTYLMRCCFLPINMSFSCTMVCSNQLEMLKVTESVMSKLYSVNIFYVDLGMMNVQASYTLPTDYTQERTTSYALNDQKEYNVTFSIEVKTFMPVFEHGLLLDEIVEMSKNVDGNILQLREDKYGKVEIRSGGLITEFEANVHTEAPPRKDLQSNQNPLDKEKDYNIKIPGYSEKQNEIRGTKGYWQSQQESNVIETPRIKKETTQSNQQQTQETTSTIKTISELKKEINPNEEIEINGDITFVFRSGRFAFFEDKTSAMLVYDYGVPIVTTMYIEGDVIKGGICGKVQSYNGMIELLPTRNFPPATGIPYGYVKPKNVTIDEIKRNYKNIYESRLVTITNVNFITKDNFVQNNETMQIFNRFNTITKEIPIGSVATITGFVAYNSNYGYMIWPRDNNDIIIHK